MGFFSKLLRANSKNLAGWVEGSITHLKKGERQFSVEDGKVVLWIVGADDIVLDPSQVQSFELVSENLPRKYGNDNMICDAYTITLTNGESGVMTIFKGKIGNVKLALRK